MPRYVFSGGRIRVERDTSLRPRKPRHALGSTFLLIVERANRPARQLSGQRKEERNNGQN